MKANHRLTHVEVYTVSVCDQVRQILSQNCVQYHIYIYICIYDVDHPYTTDQGNVNPLVLLNTPNKCVPDDICIRLGVHVKLYLQHDL